MILILLKTSIIIAVVLAFYKIVIEKESFFATNRLYLILGLVLTFTIPFVTLPKLIENQGVVSNLIETNQSTDVRSRPNNFNANPVDILDENQPIIADLSEENKTAEIANLSAQISLSDWLLYIYLFGAIVLFINLISQILNLLIKVAKSKDRIRDTDGIIINSTNIKEPCSFFNYIFINPEQYEFDIYEQIIAHEKIHVKKRHSIDLILSEIAVIMLWFNPFVWLFRKEVEKNIEYQTDHLILDGNTAEKDNYQMNLLKIATFNKPLTITTNYNQSLIKQRILKMNKKKSNPHSYWKYAFTMPLFFAVLLLLNKPYTSFAQQRSSEPQINDILSTENLEEGSESNYFSDCEAFKNALEDKNIEKLKEILVNLDPDCIDYIETSNQTTLANVKTKLEEGSDLKLDTTGNLVLTDPNGNNSDDIKVFDDTETETTQPENSDCRALLEAIRADDINKVKALIVSTDVNCVDPNPGYTKTKSNGNYWSYQKAKTSLFAVARTGNLEIAKLLVENGADVKRVLRGDGTALIASAEYGHLELVKYFVAQGADINQTFSNQGNALIAASGNGHLEVMKYLISLGADINHYSSNQGNALIAASHNDNADAVKFLVEKGMNIHFISPNQGNALIAAANRGQLETVKYLISKGAEINKISPNQGTPLIAAANNGHQMTVSYLLEEGANIDMISPNQGTALIAAANNGHLKVVEFLVARGAEVNKSSPNQGTAVNAAANNGHSKIMKYLISNGADINYNTDSQGSALISASKNGLTDTVIYLIEQGADIDAQTNGQGSALSAAAKNGQLETVKLLVSKKADINLQNNGQGSALNAAARNGQNTIIEFLLSKGADINLQNNGQGSPLNAAARNGQMTTVKLLIDKGADVNLQNNGQGSPLNAAARNGHLDIVKLLIDKGADINLYNNGHGTALSAASKNKHQKTVDYLLSKGAEHIYGN